MDETADDAVAAVVGERVVRLGDADLVVGAVGGLAGELEGDDARDIALHGEDLEVKHEPCMLRIARGHAAGPARCRQHVCGRRALQFIAGDLRGTRDVRAQRFKEMRFSCEDQCSCGHRSSHAAEWKGQNL